MRNPLTRVSIFLRALAASVRRSLAYVRRNPDYGAWMFFVIVMTCGVMCLLTLTCILIALVQKMIPWVK